MVAICNVENEFDQNPKTLGDWVKNVRMKRMHMKRKLHSGGNLRVCAILSTALMSAEMELRRKQQERFQKWLEFQTKIQKNYEFQPRDELHHHRKTTLTEEERGLNDQEMVRHHVQNADECCKRSEEIEKLWKCELSDLDNFMRSISSSNNSNSKNSDNYQANLVQKQTIEVAS